MYAKKYEIIYISPTTASTPWSHWTGTPASTSTRASSIGTPSFGMSSSSTTASWCARSTTASRGVRGSHSLQARWTWRSYPHLNHQGHDQYKINKYNNIINWMNRFLLENPNGSYMECIQLFSNPNSIGVWRLRPWWLWLLRKWWWDWSLPRGIGARHANGSIGRYLMHSDDALHTQHLLLGAEHLLQWIHHGYAIKFMDRRGGWMSSANVTPTGRTPSTSFCNQWTSRAASSSTGWACRLGDSSRLTTTSYWVGSSTCVSSFRHFSRTSISILIGYKWYIDSICYFYYSRYSRTTQLGISPNWSQG